MYQFVAQFRMGGNKWKTVQVGYGNLVQCFQKARIYRNYDYRIVIRRIDNLNGFVRVKGKWVFENLMK